MVINLDDEKYWRYAGTCRHCGFKNQFVVDKSAMSYIRFYKVVMEAYYPQWISFVMVVTIKQFMI